MKRIVVCCDGTWNTPDKNKDGVPLQTNVVKIAQAVKPVSDFAVRQLTCYNTGIGTTGSALKRLYDGATGSGISKNILEAYKFLILSYEPDDELYFFGFSRGAFTVRSLAGLIYNSGILRKDCIDMIDRSYKLYRSRKRFTHPKEKEATLFRKTYSVIDRVPIKFIGVWDTVGALGNPLLINSALKWISRATLSTQFHDTKLGPVVEHAYQALAIDEKRRNFKPAVWIKNLSAKNQVLEQKWFAGAHSNIGGSYQSTALSDIALEWMTDKAQTCGLDLEKIHVKPDHRQKPENSLTGFYWLMGSYLRPIALKENTEEAAHESVNKKFIEDKSYHPLNLVEYMNRKKESA